MRFSLYPEHKIQSAPDGFVYPLSIETLNHEFNDILLSSHCFVQFVTVENTSDVFIVRNDVTLPPLNHLKLPQSNSNNLQKPKFGLLNESVTNQEVLPKQNHDLQPADVTS